MSCWGALEHSGKVQWPKTNSQPPPKSIYQRACSALAPPWAYTDRRDPGLPLPTLQHPGQFSLPRYCCRGWLDTSHRCVYQPQLPTLRTVQLTANGNDSKWNVEFLVLLKCPVVRNSKCIGMLRVCGVTKKKLYLNRWKPVKGLTGNSLITKEEFFFLFNKMDSVHEAI